jgi:activator of HSP90 ATPase
MTATNVTRRSFTLASGLAAGLGVAGASAQAGAASDEGSPAGLGISRTNAAIHQEMAFKTSPAHLYRLLTDPRRFDKVVARSKAMRSMAIKPSPCVIDAHPGGAFALFGGYITGRQLELAPGVRIIQTWRSAGWPEHIHSIVKFEFAAQGDGAKITLDQIGFPNGAAFSVATGWHDNYWDPMTAVLAGR